MTTGTSLKNLRQRYDMTLGQLGDKISTTHSYIAQIETGKTKPSDEKLNEILTLGFGFEPQEAKKTVDKWRIEERLEKGNITIGELNVNGGQVQNIYGDNHTFNMGEEKNIFELIKELKKQGVPVEAVLQALKK